MTIDEVMKRWCETFGNHPLVLEWLEQNPPPKDWQRSTLEWVYDKMPINLKMFDE